MKKSSELKMRAKRTLYGKYMTAAGSTLILAILFIALFMGLELISLMSVGFPAYSFSRLLLNGILSLVMFCLTYLLGILVLSIFAAGQLRMFMNMTSGGRYEIGDLLSGFHHPFKLMGLILIRWLIGLVIGLPLKILDIAAKQTGYIPMMSLLTTVIGIVTLAATIWVSLDLALSFIILMENPQKGVFRSLSESHRMMKGNKWRLLYINISFIGMWILSALSLFIGLLWVEPYTICTYIHFYYDIKSARTAQMGAPQGGSYDQGPYLTETY